MISRADRKTTFRRAPSLALAVAILATPVMAQTSSVPALLSTSEANDSIAMHVTDAARRFGIPASWIWAVMRMESAGDSRAVSPAGALGLMQIMPSTWAYLRSRYGLGADPFDARDNVMAGAAFLRELYDRFGAPGFLGAYNAGPERYQDYLATGRPLPAETMRYLMALAPNVSGSQPWRGRPVPLDPSAWTRAPLFSLRPADGSSAESATRDEQRQPSRKERSAAGNLAPGPGSSRLFAPLTNRDPS